MGESVYSWYLIAEWCIPLLSFRLFSLTQLTSLTISPLELSRTHEHAHTLISSCFRLFACTASLRWCACVTEGLIETTSQGATRRNSCLARKLNKLETCFRARARISARCRENANTSRRSCIPYDCSSPSQLLPREADGNECTFRYRRFHLVNEACRSEAATDLGNISGVFLHIMSYVLLQLHHDEWIYSALTRVMFIRSLVFLQ